MDPFVHLHVASGYSLQYGASHPHVLVERAAEQEMDTLALTDRDGTYGAVKHRPGLPGRRAPAGARASTSRSVRWSRQGVARASRDQRPRTPVRGGAFRDDRRGCPG